MGGGGQERRGGRGGGAGSAGESRTGAEGRQGEPLVLERGKANARGSVQVGTGKRSELLRVMYLMCAKALVCRVTGTWTDTCSACTYTHVDRKTMNIARLLNIAQTGGCKIAGALMKQQ